jgi:DinB superfamily
LYNLVAKNTIFAATKILYTMKAQKSYQNWLKTAAFYESELPKYSEQDFSKKQTEEAWSIGQMYQHLIKGTMFFHIKFAENALESAENSHEGKTFPGKLSFFIGGFPPVKIKVPASAEYTPPQPKSKETVAEDLQKLKIMLKDLAEKIDASPSKGKTKHPAFGYLTAFEWYQMIDMHFKHHLRQKKRLDQFLGK